MSALPTEQHQSPASAISGSSVPIASFAVQLSKQQITPASSRARRYAWCFSDPPYNVPVSVTFAGLVEFSIASSPWPRAR